MKREIQLYKLFTILIFSLVTLSFSIPKQKISLIASAECYTEGCFGAESRRLILYKEGHDTICLYEKKSDNLSNIQKAKASSKDVQKFDIFLQRYTLMNTGHHCITVAYYKAFYKNKMISKTDAGCQFHDFDQLENSFFKKQ